MLQVIAEKQEIISRREPITDLNDYVAGSKQTTSTCECKKVVSYI